VRVDRKSCSFHLVNKRLFGSGRSSLRSLFLTKAVDRTELNEGLVVVIH